MAETHNTQLQLNNKYAVDIEIDIQLGSNYDNTEFDLTEKYENLTMIDLETEETFKLKQLLPPLRHELEYLIKSKFESYVYNNFNELLIELAPDDWMSEQQSKSDRDHNGHKH